MEAVRPREMAIDPRKGWLYHDGGSIHPKVVPPIYGTAIFAG